MVLRQEPGALLNLPTQPAILATDTLTTTSTTTPTSTPSPIPTNPPDCVADVHKNLNVHLQSDSTGTVSNGSHHCFYAVGLAAYRMPDDNLSHQQLFSSQTAIVGPGETVILAVELPGCAYQLDLFYGPLIESFDPQHGRVYGDRILTTRVVRRGGFCPPATTTPVATASPTPTASETPPPGGN